MNVSLNWAQYYSNVPLTQQGLPEIVKRIGAQLGAIESITNYGERYDDVVVAHVVSCHKHPDADRLSVCKVDDGGAVKDVERDEQGFVQVVCGAPNVREGLTVAWLPPGSVVPASVDSQPFKLESRAIRGQISNGMLASPQELAISDSHEGILEISASDVGEELITPGTPFKRLYGLDDVVIDCENKMFTHRPDCFGIIGVARELAGIQQLHFKSPDWYLEPPQFDTANELPLHVTVSDDSLVPRFMAVAMDTVTIGELPTWMQAALVRTGYRSINSVVDITNYMMHLTGQPIHAYDYDKVAALSDGVPHLTARPAVTGETIKLLNGKTITLQAGTIVIATNKAVIGIAGVMGGADTEVDATTTRIIIEVGTFDMYAIRRASMQYGLFTDAVTRFNKGQSPLQNDRILAKIMTEMHEQTGAQQASPVLDVKAASVKPATPVVVSVNFINRRLGSSLSAAAMQALLANVEITANIKDDTLTVVPPFWRRDLAIPEDFVEEIGRLYGFDQLPVVMPRRPSKATRKDPDLTFLSTIRRHLAQSGANELLTYSFVHADMLHKVGLEVTKAFHIRNAISPELQYYRVSILPSLLDKVQQNIRANQNGMQENQFALFELNKVHVKGIPDANEPDIPAEHPHVALVIAADDKTAAESYAGSAFYTAAAYLKSLFSALHVSYTLQPIVNEVTDLIAAPFAEQRMAAIQVDGRTIGYIGEFKQSVDQAFKLPVYCAGFELNTSMLQRRAGQRAYTVVPVYPKSEQDLTLSVADAVNFQKVAFAVHEKVNSMTANDSNLFCQFSLLDIYQPENGGMRYSFRFWFARYDRTLKTNEVSAYLDAIAAHITTSCGAERI